MIVLDVLTADLARLLLARHEWVCTAEYCTGGQLAAALTDRAGSSAWFAYGWVVYGNAAKTRCLAVDADILADHGAVSAEVLQAMLAGALQASGADLALASTGIAGPGGGTADKPVGTVWLGAQHRQLGSRLELQHFSGTRAEVREKSVRRLLELALDRLNNCT